VVPRGGVNESAVYRWFRETPRRRRNPKLPLLWVVTVVSVVALALALAVSAPD
jgi:hypothetical protein